MALEFKYSADQQHQIDDINAVCELFHGQESMGAWFTVGSYGGVCGEIKEICHE